jgi:hypothetical protein
MLLGSKDILLSAWQASAPHHGPGRDNKVGREEHIGMLAAVEAWVKHDHAAKEKAMMSWLDIIAKRVSGIESVTTALREPAGLNNRSASLSVSWNPGKLNITADEVAEDFAKNKPRIAIGAGGRGGTRIPGSSPGGGGGPAAIAAAAAAAAKAAQADAIAGITTISISASMMQPGDCEVVADRLYEILSRKRSHKSTSMKTPSADITGPWDVSVEFYNSSSEHKFFIHKQDGNWLKGSHKGDVFVQDMAGTIEGDRVKLLSTYSAAGDYIPFTFHGTVSGDTMSGDIHMGEYRSAKFTAKRYSHTVENVPVSIPNFGRRNANAW